MSAEFKMLFFGVAIILFVIAVFATRRPQTAPGREMASIGWVAAGLVSATIPFFWDALEVATS